MDVQLHLVHLYPNIMNLYGDRGNIITLKRRAGWRGIDLRVHEVGLEEDLPEGEIDLLFMGGDQDREQLVVIDDLRERHGEEIQELVEDRTPFLAVCGGYQLLQKFYRPAEGPDLEGLGLIDAHTVHPGHETARCVGNIVVEWDATTIVGFENHGGRTYLEGDTQPLGRVIKGYGNNGQDRFEGARIKNVFGTYVHGSLLPKNPTLADAFLDLAVRRRYPDYDLAPIDDELESRAHDAAVASA